MEEAKAIARETEEGRGAAIYLWHDVCAFATDRSCFRTYRHTRARLSPRTCTRRMYRAIR